MFAQDNSNLYLSKHELFGCFNSKDDSINILLLYLNFHGGYEIFGGCLNVVLLKHDGKTQKIINAKLYNQMLNNEKNVLRKHYDIVIINNTYVVGGSYDRSTL